MTCKGPDCRVSLGHSLCMSAGKLTRCGLWQRCGVRRRSVVGAEPRSTREYVAQVKAIQDVFGRQAAHI